MKISTKTKSIIAILTTVIVISLIASQTVLIRADSVFINGSTTNINYLPDMQTTSYNAQYSSAATSAYESARAKWGDPTQEAYFSGNPVFANGQRTCFTNGPAPDRPDVLWTTGDMLTGYKGTSLINYTYPVIESWTTAPLCMAGQVIGSATIRLPNNTLLTGRLTSLDPATGAINWYVTLPAGVTSTFVGPLMDKVDETHFIINHQMMYRTDGTLMWRDTSIAAGDTYNTNLVAAAPGYKVFGVSGTSPGQRVSVVRAYNLSDPDTNMGPGGRSLWNYTIDEPGEIAMCYDPDHDIYVRGSYAAYAVIGFNASTGEKLWQTYLPTATGYAGCYANGRVWVGCQSMAETCLNVTTGEVLWRNNDGESNRAFNVWQVGFAYDRVYYHDLGSGRTGAQKCYDAYTGQKLWASTALFSIGYYVFRIADGKVYGNQADGSTTTGRQADPVAFCCWDAFSGEILWKLRQGITDPVIAYGCLFFTQSSVDWTTGATQTVLVCMSTAYPPSNWYEWRGNTANPGITMDDAPRDFSGGPVWTFKMGAGTCGTPTVADGKVYLGSSDSNIYCLDAYNGTMIWKFHTNEPRMTHWGSTPLVYKNIVMIGPDDGWIYGLNKDTGDVVWKINAGPYIAVKVGLGQFEVRSSPILYNDYAYVGSHSNSFFYCIEPLSGQIRWMVNLTASIGGSAGFGNGSAWVMTWGNRLFRIDANPDVNLGGGKVQMNISISGPSMNSNTWTPVLNPSGSIVYYGGSGSNIIAYNTTTGTTISHSIQPHVLSENSCGSMMYVPGFYLSAVNQTLSSPTMRNGTVWAGIPITYVNTTSTAQVAAYTYYKGQYTFGATIDKLMGQAGPTIFCAVATEVNVTATVPPGGTGSRKPTN